MTVEPMPSRGKPEHRGLEEQRKQRERRRLEEQKERRLQGVVSMADAIGEQSFPASDPPAVWTWDVPPSRR
jgi:hypothetical protein